MNANDRYGIAIKRMRKDGIPVPHGIMRAALDESRAVLRNRPGYHPVVITITGTAPKAIVDAIEFVPENTILRVAGQSFRDTWV